MLILAAISITMLAGDNSILKRVAQAKENNIIAEENEQIKLAVNSSRIDELGENAKAKGVRSYLKSQGLNASVYQNEDEIEIEYLDTGHKYIVKANGEIEKQEGTDTEEKNVYYKIDGTTLYLSSIKKDESYKEIQDYYYNTNNEYNFPDWVGKITINEEGNGILPISSIEKVIIENRIQPKNTSYWFFQCKSLKIIENIGRIDTRDTINMRYMFSNCTSLPSLDVSNFNTSNVTNMQHLFYNCTSLTSLDVSNLNTSNVMSMLYMFCNCTSLPSLNVSNFDTSKVTSMSGMFQNCTSLTSLDVSNFNTNNVTNMRYMFSECSSLTTLDLSSFHTEEVTDMAYMFHHCTSLTSLDISNFNTNKVLNMGLMFSGCSSLTSLNLNGFDTRNVKIMNSMFENCTNLISLDLSNFHTEEVTGMKFMFSGYNNLSSLNISNFNTAKVTTMQKMFNVCNALTVLDLSSFDTSNVESMSSMFYNCRNLETIYASEKWSTAKCTTTGYVFRYNTKLTGGLGTKYTSSYHGTQYARIDGGTESPGYFTAK